MARRRGRRPRRCRTRLRWLRRRLLRRRRRRRRPRLRRRRAGSAGGAGPRSLLLSGGGRRRRIGSGAGRRRRHRHRGRSGSGAGRARFRANSKDAEQLGRTNCLTYVSTYLFTAAEPAPPRPCSPVAFPCCSSSCLYLRDFVYHTRSAFSLPELELRPPQGPRRTSADGAHEKPDNQMRAPGRWGRQEQWRSAWGGVRKKE